MLRLVATLSRIELDGLRVGLDGLAIEFDGLVDVTRVVGGADVVKIDVLEEGEGEGEDEDEGESVVCGLAAGVVVDSGPVVGLGLVVVSGASGVDMSVFSAAPGLSAISVV